MCRDDFSPNNEPFSSVHRWTTSLPVLIRFKLLQLRYFVLALALLLKRLVYQIDVAHLASHFSSVLPSLDLSFQFLLQESFLELSLVCPIEYI
jgi:hypothetical protein